MQLQPFSKIFAVLKKLKVWVLNKEKFYFPLKTTMWTFFETDTVLRRKYQSLSFLTNNDDSIGSTSAFGYEDPSSNPGWVKGNFLEIKSFTLKNKSLVGKTDSETPKPRKLEQLWNRKLINCLTTIKP